MAHFGSVLCRVLSVCYMPHTTHNTQRKLFLVFFAMIARAAARLSRPRAGMSRMMSTPSDLPVITDIDEERAIATLTINRPKALNALNSDVRARAISATRFTHAPNHRFWRFALAGDSGDREAVQGARLG